MILITDTTQTTTASAGGPRFSVRNGEVAALRSTNLDGSAVISVKYISPDGNTLGNATLDDGTALTLTPTNPERVINLPGDYTVEVTTAATTQGVVFVNK